MRPVGFSTQRKAADTAAGLRRPAETRSAGPASRGMDRLASTVGNRAMLAMLAAQAPSHVAGAPAAFGGGGMLQRKCACESEEEPCEHCAASRKLQRRATVPDDAAGLAVPPIVREVLSGGGEPLDASVRAYMEPRFGRSFADVRVHTDARAAESARAVNADAYTVGSHIAFDSGRHAMGSRAGRRLMAHELTHVVQQSAGGFTPTAAHEREADRTAAHVVAGHAAPAATGAGPGLQRQEKEAGDAEVPSVFGNAAVNRLVGQLPLGTPTHVAAAAVSGLVAGTIAELSGPTGTLIAAKLASFRPKDMPALATGYGVGVGEGVVSPITDLFGLARFIQHVEGMAVNMGIGALSGRVDIIEEIRALAQPLDAVQKALDASMKRIRENPMKAMNAILALPQKIAEQAPKQAYTAAHEGGRSIAKSMLDPWEEGKKKEDEPAKNKGTLDKLSEGYDELKGKIVDVPWAKVGNKVGYAVGFAVINTAMMFLTEGVGNAIVEAANALGKVAKSLGAFARGAEMIADVARVAGTVIADIERLINLATAKLLKPLEPILEPLMKPFAEFAERLGKVLKKLLGAAEKKMAEEGATKVATGAVKGVTKVAHTPPAPHKPPHKAGPPKPKEKPHAPHKASGHEPGAPAHAEAPKPDHAPKPDNAPHHDAASADKPVSGAPEAKAQEAPVIKKPAAEGHHIEVASDGIHVCSPPPCPLLHVEYAAELKADADLMKQWEEIDKLRKSKIPAQMERASEQAAAMQQHLASLRARKRIAAGAKLTPQQQRELERIFELANASKKGMTKEATEELIRRLRGKSKAEVDAALAELREAVADIPATKLELEGRRGAEPVKVDRTEAPANKPGRSNTAAPKTGPENPAGYEDMMSETGAHTRDTLGTKQPNPSTTVGIDVHMHFEDLPPHIRARIEEAFPEGLLPRGLSKEVQVPDWRLPPLRRPRMDRVDFEKGIIYEIGPKKQKFVKEAEAKVYAGLMDQFAPLKDGKKWHGEARTYDEKTMMRFARRVGLLPKKAPR